MSDGKHEALPLGFPAPHVSYGLETCRQGWDIIVKWTAAFSCPRSLLFPLFH